MTIDYDQPHFCKYLERVFLDQTHKLFVNFKERKPKSNINGSLDATFHHDHFNLRILNTVNELDIEFSTISSENWSSASLCRRKKWS